MEPKIQVITVQGPLVCSCGCRVFRRADPKKYTLARYLCYKCGKFNTQRPADFSAAGRPRRQNK